MQLNRRTVSGCKLPVFSSGRTQSAGEKKRNRKGEQKGKLRPFSERKKSLHSPREPISVSLSLCLSVWPAFSRPTDEGPQAVPRQVRAAKLTASSWQAHGKLAAAANAPTLSWPAN